MAPGAQGIAISNAEKFLDGAWIDAGHHEPAREGVAEVGSPQCARPKVLDN